MNIATQMLLDAVHDAYDTAMLVSGDGDLLPPTVAVESTFAPKQVWLALPPGASNRALEDATSGKLRIRMRDLEACQLPSTVFRADGFGLVRPDTWSKPSGKFGEAPDH